VGLDDEHSLCRALESAGGSEMRKVLFAKHRSEHYGEATFEKLARSGVNAVRLPFGHWVVAGPGEGEAYEGPCLEILDRAVELANAHGLQVLLDLHGNPGGESGDRPCGKSNPKWRWQDWRREEAVELLGKVAARFSKDKCVTGLQVCNEPSDRVPVGELCGFYERAIEAIRAAGMGPDHVAVVLPIFTHWRAPEIVSYWHKRGNFFKYDNVAFDFHYYHQFDPIWKMLSQAQHLDVVADHARELALLPGAVVGEWSLSRPSKFSEEDKAAFAVHQVMGYNHSTHGWFFWNWHDHEFYPDWDMERGLLDSGKLPCPLTQRELREVLYPEWERDSWANVPTQPIPAFWPKLFGWAAWAKRIVGK